YLNGNIQLRGLIAREARKTLSVDLPQAKGPRKPFQWPLEFPEIFVRKNGGFDGVVGNPPFMGGKIIATACGPGFAKYLRMVFFRARNTADLCSYFFQRCTLLLCEKGCLGMLATNSIGQGDTSECGLGFAVEKGATIYFARSTFVWPGSANVYASYVCLRKGNHRGSKELDGKTVESITPRLREDKGKASIGTPKRIKRHAVDCFVGSFVRGMGFVISPTEAEAIRENDANSPQIIFPYLNGEDLYSNARCEATRDIINFFDWPIEKARRHKNAFRIVEERVFQFRQTVKEKSAREKWWQYAGLKKELYDAISDLRKVLVRARVSNTHAIVLVQSRQVFSDQIVVFGTDSMSIFAVLQSTIHETWIRQYGSTLKGDQRYSPSECFDTFVFPHISSDLEKIGNTYHQVRDLLLKDTQEGLTNIYKRFHDISDSTPGIRELRKLHEEIDSLVTSAYGWKDLDLQYGFHKMNQGIRFTISEEAKVEITRRLLKLNHERYEEEVGLHHNSKK
ncbi:MAG: hypothetical protein PHS86_15315, partial [Syntrophaceae bacterium]|nr:hypothetical protein [Syntrophaceae bacterium]